MNWIDTLGRDDAFNRGHGAHYIADMTPRTAQNIITALHRHALSIAVETLAARTGHTAPWLPTTAAATRAMVTAPRAWLATTPLVQALADRAAAGVAVDWEALT